MSHSPSAFILNIMTGAGGYIRGAYTLATIAQSPRRKRSNCNKTKHYVRLHLSTETTIYNRCTHTSYMIKIDQDLDLLGTGHVVLVDVVSMSSLCGFISS